MTIKTVLTTLAERKAMLLYAKTPLGRAAQKRWRQSEKGKVKRREIEHRYYWNTVRPRRMEEEA